MSWACKRDLIIYKKPHLDNKKQSWGSFSNSIRYSFLPSYCFKPILVLDPNPTSFTSWPTTSAGPMSRGTTQTGATVKFTPKKCGAKSTLQRSFHQGIILPFSLTPVLEGLAKEGVILNRFWFTTFCVLVWKGAIPKTTSSSGSTHSPNVHHQGHPSWLVCTRIRWACRGAVLVLSGNTCIDDIVPKTKQRNHK